MPIEMHKGKDSKVVNNRDVRQHRAEGWTFNKPSTKTVLQKKITARKPRATLKVEEPIVEPKTITDLPGPEDFNLNIEE